MTSLEVAELLDRITETIDFELNIQNLNELLGYIDSFHAKVRSSLNSILSESESTKRTSSFETFRESFNHSLAPKLKEVSSRRIYAELERMISGLERVCSDLYGPSWRTQDFLLLPLGSLAEEAAAFTDAYEAFIHKSTHENMMKLLWVGYDLRQSINENLRLASFIRAQLKAGPDLPPPGYEEISLNLDFQDSYKDVLAKLTAVNELYSELCSMAGVSPAEHPLQVIKIESGSLWLKLFGESRVIGLLIKLIESGASFIYRNFTAEGKVQSIPRQVEAVEAVLRLSENLEKAGVDVTQVKDNLQTSAAIISGQLNNLLRGVKSVNVNEETFSVGKALEERFLKEGRALLLEDGDSDDGNNGNT